MSFTVSYGVWFDFQAESPAVSVRANVREDLQNNDLETCSNKAVCMTLNVWRRALTLGCMCVAVCLFVSASFKPCLTDTLPSFFTERIVPSFADPCGSLASLKPLCLCACPCLPEVPATLEAPWLLPPSTDPVSTLLPHSSFPPSPAFCQPDLIPSMPVSPHLWKSTPPDSSADPACHRRQTAFIGSCDRKEITVPSTTASSFSTSSSCSYFSFFLLS